MRGIEAWLMPEGIRNLVRKLVGATIVPFASTCWFPSEGTVGPSQLKTTLPLLMRLRPSALVSPSADFRRPLPLSLTLEPESVDVFGRFERSLSVAYPDFPLGRNPHLERLSCSVADPQTTSRCLCFQVSERTRFDVFDARIP